MEKSTKKTRIKIGTRGSALALAQADLFANAICEKYPDVICEIKVIVTQGDKELDKELSAFGGKGVFVSAIEEALCNGEIDVAVHSGKDLPMELAKGMTIGAVLMREDPRDVFIVRRDRAGQCSKIGCGSIRRSVQLKKIYPDIVIKPIRGNVPTRLDKVRKGEFDGTVLAMAGLNRLNIHEDDELMFIPFDTLQMVPAGCQGIIAVEMREDDSLIDVVSKISHKETERVFNIERGILKQLNAGCQEPVGVLARLKDNVFYVRLLRIIEGEINLTEFILHEGESWEKYI